MPRPNTRRPVSVAQRAQENWDFNEDDYDPNAYSSEDETPPMNINEDDYDPNAYSSEDETPPMNTVSPQEVKEKRENDIKVFEKNIANFPKNHNGYTLIGKHETNNAASIIKTGPAIAKVGTKSGSGKGRGFYVTPLNTKLLGGFDNYGESIVAVYIRSDAKRRGFANAITVEEAEKKYIEEFGEDKDTPCYYIPTGGEIIIPERCFGLVKLAEEPSNLNW